jgi:hypothetical protein
MNTVAKKKRKKEKTPNALPKRHTQAKRHPTATQPPPKRHKTTQTIHTHTPNKQTNKKKEIHTHQTTHYTPSPSPYSNNYGWK